MPFNVLFGVSPLDVCSGAATGGSKFGGGWLMGGATGVMDG